MSALSNPARAVRRIVEEHFQDLATRAHDNDLVSGKAEIAQGIAELFPRHRHVRDINVIEALAGSLIHLHFLDGGVVYQSGTPKLERVLF